MSHFRRHIELDKNSRPRLGKKTKSSSWGGVGALTQTFPAKRCGAKRDFYFLAGWLGELDQLAQHGGCDVLEGTKWVANLWLTLVGKPGTEEAFKGWIDYGKDETKYKLGTNWKGEALKTGEETKETQENQEGAATKTDEEKREEKEKTLKEAKERGDGSYDVKLEL